jgi:hypothetical protein
MLGVLLAKLILSGATDLAAQTITWQDLGPEKPQISASLEARRLGLPLWAPVSSVVKKAF